MPYLPAAKINTVVVPMVQVMGLSCSVYGMNIIDKKVYTLQRISSFRYPSTQREVKSGGIKSLLDGFSLVKVNETNWNRFCYFIGLLFNFLLPFLFLPFPI